MTLATEAPFEVAFLDKLQNLLAEGDFTATYKFAVLLGLVELSVETATGTDTFTTRHLAEKVVELYWPQALSYEGVELRQNPHRQARILSAVAGFRAEAARAGLAAAPLMAVARRFDERWRKLLEMRWSGASSRCRSRDCNVCPREVMNSSINCPGRLKMSWNAGPRSGGKCGLTSAARATRSTIGSRCGLARCQRWRGFTESCAISSRCVGCARFTT